MVFSHLHWYLLANISLHESLNFKYHSVEGVGIEIYEILSQKKPHAINQSKKGFLYKVELYVKQKQVFLQPISV